MAPGDVVAGKYAVVRLIGRGGMGSVFEARHRALGQRVAIKFLDAGSAENSEAVERFLREARAAANLTSEHVVRVFDVGTHDTGLPFMVMEFLDGLDLGQLIERKGPLPVNDAVRYVLQASEAVAEAHEAGIVHRDLKPSNLFLATSAATKRSAKVKVLDFGISKHGGVADGSVLTLTGPKSVMGSPSYMSPEQVRSTKSVDARTDVWSLGVILYELLTGKLAFDGESLGDVFAKIREEPLLGVRTLRPAVPASLEEVISRCLERDRERRFADAAELADALRAVSLEGGIEDEPSSIGGRRSGTQATTAFDLRPSAIIAPLSSGPESGTHAPWISQRKATPHRGLVALIVALGVGACGLAVAAVLLAQRPTADPPPYAPAAETPAAEAPIAEKPREETPTTGAPSLPTATPSSPPTGRPTAPPAVAPEPEGAAIDAHASSRRPGPTGSGTPHANPSASLPVAPPPAASSTPAARPPLAPPPTPPRPTADPNDLGI